MTTLTWTRATTWRLVRHYLEMAAAMYVPFVVLFPPLWMGLITAGTMLVAGHVLMLPAMAGAMLLRPHEYRHCHGEETHR